MLLYLLIPFSLTFLRAKNMKTKVIGCPKTIDGDLKCKEVPTTFGFDTACKVSNTSTVVLFFFYLPCFSFFFNPCFDCASDLKLRILTVIPYESITYLKSLNS